MGPNKFAMLLKGCMLMAFSALIKPFYSIRQIKFAFKIQMFDITFYGFPNYAIFSPDISSLSSEPSNLLPAGRESIAK